MSGLLNSHFEKQIVKFFVKYGREHKAKFKRCDGPFRIISNDDSLALSYALGAYNLILFKYAAGAETLVEEDTADTNPVIAKWLDENNGEN